MKQLTDGFVLPQDALSVLYFRKRAVRLMKELDTADGIGLIVKKRIGLGRPNRIYNGGRKRRNENRSGGACRIQTQAADILHSSGLSRKKAAEPKGRPGFAGEMPEVNAGAENTAVVTVLTPPLVRFDPSERYRRSGSAMLEKKQMF